MSYYRPSFSQTVAMSRGGRGFSSSRGSSYRGTSSRGSSWGGRGSYTSSPASSRFSSSVSSSFDSRSKYGGNTDRYSSSRSHPEPYRKPYRDSGAYSGRDSHRSPERKRMRNDNLSSRHDSSFGQDYSRYESSHYPERRSFSDDRRPAPRREEFRKPLPPSSSRGGYRGRLSSRGSIRATRFRESVSYKARNMTTFARRRLAKLRSAAMRFRKDQESIEREAREKDKDKEKEKDDDVKSEKSDKEEESTEVNESTEADAESSPKKTPKKETDAESDKEKKDDSEEERQFKTYVKLICSHCSFKAKTFRTYSLHLKGFRHNSVMRSIALKHKNILNQMRMAQRKAQKELEKSADDLAERTSFCPICKLNYRQPKATHRASDAHKNMKKFLMPVCKICKIMLKSPMLYEDHLCSIEHLKKKSYLTNGAPAKSDEGSGDDNLENFMTIDSVGDVEEEGGEGKAKDSDAKVPVNVGIESIRKVEVHYCDLCMMYLPRVEDEDLDRVLSKHCKQRTHMQRYIRFKEDKALEKRAERLQRKETAEKEKEKDGVKIEGESPKKDKSNAGDEEDQDKLWADVDKDLGDILAEAGNKSSDEDDNERYDRFKLSEGKNGEDNAVDAKSDAAEEETMETGEKEDEK